MVETEYFANFTLFVSLAHNMLLQVNLAGKSTTAASPPVQFSIMFDYLYPEIVHQEEIRLSVCACHV